MKQDFQFKTFDGLTLKGVKETVDDHKAVVVVVHGLCEHLGRYDYIAKKLVESKYTVYRFDHRGHGHSEGKETYYDDFNEIIEDVKLVVDMARAENPTSKLFLLGHSMGGYAVLLFGTKYPGMVDGVVTSGAVSRYNLPVFGPLPIELPPDTYFPNTLADGVCSDPAVIESYWNDPLVRKQVSVGLINSLHDGIEYQKANAAKFVEPVMVMHGCFDGLVAEKDSRDLYGEIGSTDKTLKIYPHIMHEIFNEKVKDEVIAEAIAWLDKHV